MENGNPLKDKRKFKIAGIVLAGGLSTRMGQDKATLSLAQESLLERAIKLLKKTGIEDVIVSGNYPSYPCILDVYPQLGPLSGLHACVNSLSESYDALFIIPVDMPLLGLAECRCLLEQFIAFPSGVYYQDATFPMILSLNLNLKNYLSEILETQDKKQRSLYRLLTKCNVQPIRYHQEQAFRFQNSNTPEQWAHCLDIHNQLQQNKEKA